jgi:hypothetical protein
MAIDRLLKKHPRKGCTGVAAEAIPVPISTIRNGTDLVDELKYRFTGFGIEYTTVNPIHNGTDLVDELITGLQKFV